MVVILKYHNITYTPPRFCYHAKLVGGEGRGVEIIMSMYCMYSLNVGNSIYVPCSLTHAHNYLEGMKRGTFPHENTSPLGILAASTPKQSIVLPDSTMLCYNCFIHITI